MSSLPTTQPAQLETVTNVISLKKHYKSIVYISTQSQKNGNEVVIEMEVVHKPGINKFILIAFLNDCVCNNFVINYMIRQKARVY